MSTLHDYPQKNHTICLFQSDSKNELIVFDQVSRHLALLNQTASEVWELHHKQLSFDSIVERLSARYDIESKVIEADVAEIFESWLDLGFIGDKKNIPESIDEVDVFEIKYKSSLDINKAKIEYCKSLKYLDTVFSISVIGEKIINTILPIISHFKNENESSAKHNITIAKVDNIYEIIEDGNVVATCDSLNNIAPLLNAYILITSYQESDNLSVFHAGAVTKGNGVVLLSGVPGSGKSTLVSALMCSDVTVFTDEISLLTKTKKIRPAPGVIGLKKGSWGVIEKVLPEIQSLPIHIRQDKKEVKYIQPKNLPNNDQQIFGEHAKAIVFPVYSEKCTTRVKRITSSEALVWLTRAGYYTSQTLNSDTVKELISWVSDIPAYELQMNDLDKAVELVLELL